MSNAVPSVSPIEIGVASGLLGAGIGYLAAPRKYDLEDLLTQKPDVFEKSIPKELLVNESEHKAYKLIETSRALLAKACKENTGDKVLAELTKNEGNKAAYNIIKDLIPKTRTKTAIITGILAGLATITVRYLTDTKN